MSRVPLVVANWKMNHTASEAADFAARVCPLPAPLADAVAASRLEVAIAPAFPALDRLGRALAGSGIALAAQDCHEAVSGAHTGEVSAAMLEDLGCRYVLLGHSERRQHAGDSDARVAAKLARVLASRLEPILCVGETLAERESGRVEAVLERQLATAIPVRAEQIPGLERRLAIAYEPIWAIGTGRVATPPIAQAAHAAIRRLLGNRMGSAGARVRILYGGSVKPDNVRPILDQPDVDGALVGGASLVAEDFVHIAASCLAAKREPA